MYQDSNAAYCSASILRDAYSVLLPAYDRVDVEDVRHFLDQGGSSILLGCSRREYVARRMSSERQEREDAALFRKFGEEVRNLVPNALIAIDYEIGGVHRLHKLAPQLDKPEVALAMTLPEVEAFGISAGKAARELGVNYILSPVLDMLSGPNPWLRDRTLAADPKRVSEITSAFIKGAQSEGIAATAKHFPGHPKVVVDPFDSADVIVEASHGQLAFALEPFKLAIASGVKSVMTGPIPVPQYDPLEPSSTSAAVVRILRGTLGFGGLIVSDDIDLPGTLRGRSVPEVAVASLNAGIDLLLLAGGAQVDVTARAIADAVEQGRLEPSKLQSAAANIRATATSVVI
ncbi:glycoside hydrolase family 3 protein [Rhizobium sp. BK060]|uniref:glycoside hydrolase family 3 protein n=1 Tax=Rhizobium sp. BK060 TaxID=2587096 RepID=UPI0016184413|nr:glycoside hydrolase family 3 protein [Rhizobium sp. BK060]MBB3396001.1 beta-N-acetylhexosaminidase [Rhizobium sp. BK060]